MEQFVLNTPQTRKVIDELGVVPLVADLTDGDPDGSRWLESLNPAGGLPTLAIFPQGRKPAPADIFTGNYTQAQLFERLRQAGPSLDIEQQASRADEAAQ